VGERSVAIEGIFEILKLGASQKDDTTIIKLTTIPYN
jgi:hypothetical protein